MEMTNAQRIARRMGQLRSERGPTEAILQQIADHVVGRGDFSTERATDERRDYYIYDTTSMTQSNLLSAALYSILAAGRFFTLGVDDPELENDEDVAYWLDDTGRKMLSAILAPEANFAPQLHEAIQDLVDFGTAGLLIQDVPGKGVRFSSVPLGQIFIAEDGFGRVNTVYRRFTLTNDQVWQRWGSKIKDSDIREEYLKRASDNPDEDRHIIHAIEPNDSALRDALGRSNRPFVSYYIDEGQKNELEAGFHDELPIVTPRWRKIPGIAYGYSPGRVALPAQMMLNEMERSTMEAAQQAVRPPLLVPNDGTIVQIDRDPDGLISYNPDVSSQRGSGIEYLESRSRFEVAFQMMEMRKNDVRQAYHFEIQNIFTDPRMSATQVVELSTRATQLMGPMLERLQVEGLEPIIERVFGIMMRAGKLLPAPEALGGRTLNIRYISPAARSQMAEVADAVRRFRLSCIEASSVIPEAMDVCDIEESLREEAEASGLFAGSRSVRSRRMVDAMRQARNEASEEQAETQEMLSASEAVRNIAPAMQAVGGAAAA